MYIDPEAYHMFNTVYGLPIGKQLSLPEKEKNIRLLKLYLGAARIAQTYNY